jgi:hypothetical protein
MAKNHCTCVTGSLYCNKRALPLLFLQGCPSSTAASTLHVAVIHNIVRVDRMTVYGCPGSSRCDDRALALQYVAVKG